MPGSRRRPTTHDVARAAGVSAATVSYVLNDTPGRRIGLETRERVQAAADALGYRPQLAGRTLRMGRSDVVALILPEWPIGTGLLAILEGLARELTPHGFSLAIVHGSADTDVLNHVAQSLAPAAIIVFESHGISTGPGGVPIMLGIGDEPGTFAGARYDYQRFLAGLQVEHLAQHGHERIGYARSSNERLRTFVTARTEGILNAAGRLGLTDPPIFDMNDTLEDAQRAIAFFRERGCTGIAAYNDETALPLLGAAQRMGLRVPEDVAVIGLDGMPAGAYSTPTLTTIHQDSHIMTTQWCSHVLSLINGEPSPSLHMDGIAEIVQRESA